MRRVPAANLPPGIVRGLAEVIEDVQAEFDTGRLSEDQLSATIGEATAIVHAADGEASATADVARINAAVAAAPEGSTVILRGEYHVNTTISNQGKSLTFDLRDARIVKVANVITFEFTGGFDAPLAVSGLTTVAISDDMSSGSITGTQITLGSSPAWVRGDLVKLYADDVIAGSLPGSGGNESRVGKFLIVSSVEGNVVKCVGLIEPEDTYSTNIRVARLPRRAVHVIGGEFQVAQSGLDGSWTGETLRFNEMAAPTVRGTRIRSASGEAIQLVGCYGYTIDSVDVEYAKNAVGVNGYGVSDRACAFGRIVNSRFMRVRHAYTDGTPRIAAGTTSPRNYGRTTDTQIAASVCYASSNTSFDTHSQSKRVTFSDCHSVDSYMGFAFRGLSHRIFDCTVTRGREGGLFIMNETAGGDSAGHFVRGLLVEDTKRAVYADLRPAGHPSAGTREARASILNDVTIKGAGSEAVYLTNGTFDLTGLKVILGAGIATASNIVRLRNTVVEGDLWATDARPAAGSTSLRLVRLEGGSTVSVPRWGHKEPGTAAVTSLAVAGDSLGVGNMVTVSDFHSNVALGAGSNPISGVDEGSQFDWDYTRNLAGATDGQNSAWITKSDADITSTGLAGASQTLGRSRRRLVHLRLTPDAGSVEMPAFPTSYLRGQECIVWNLHGSNTVTVKHGGTYKTALTGASDKVIAAGSSIRLMWTGSSWGQIA